MDINANLILQLEHIDEALNTTDALYILCSQAPLYDFVDLETCYSNLEESLSFSQNLEDLIISIELEDKLDIQPLLHKDNWLNQEDITRSPSISLFNTGAETRSGILNGIKVMVDLGNEKYVLKKIIGICLETFDNADPTIPYDALKLIVNTKDSFPSFDLEGFSIR